MPRSQPHSKTRLKTEVGVDLSQVLVESYAVNERMNQIVLEYLDPAAWRAKLPGSKGRTIAAIVAHVHNIRRKWLRLSAPHLELPASLNRATCTQKQARAALLASGAGCSEMLANALSRPQSGLKSGFRSGLRSGLKSGPHTRIEPFLRDGWAKPWPAGAAMLAYMISHERITAARCVCWPISSDFRCRRRPPLRCGLGKNYGRSADSRIPDKDQSHQRNKAKKYPRGVHPLGISFNIV